MNRLASQVRSFWRNVTERRRVEAELDAEMQSYLQMLVDEKIRAGMDEPTARRAALVETGGAEPLKERIRDVKIGLRLDALKQDLQFGFRSLLKSRVLTVVAVVSIALGIGVNAALFSLVDRLVLTPLPVRDPDQLYILFSNNRSGDSDLFSYPDFELISSSFDIFDGIFARLIPRDYTVHANQGTYAAEAEVVTGAYFDVLGVRPAHGRLITEMDDRPGASHVIVLGHEFWMSAFAGDSGVVGRTLRLSSDLDPGGGATFTVIGVVPKGFSGVAFAQSADLFLPLEAVSAINRRDQPRNRPNAFGLQVMGRLRADINMAQARVELWNRIPNFDSAVRNPTLEPPIDEHTRKLRIRSGKHGYSALRDEYSYSLVLLMALVGVVLVVACANLANLLLVRASARVHEIATRLALGATPARIARQWLTESALLAIAGAVGGLVIALGTTDLLLMFIREEDRPLLSFQLNYRNFVFMGAMTVLTGVLFAVLPALRVSRVPLNTVAGRVSGAAIGGRRSWLTKAVAVAQVAVSLFLVASGALFGRTLANLNAESAGFDRRTVLYTELPGLRGQKPERIGLVMRNVVDRMNAAPAISRASVVYSLPMRFLPGWVAVAVPGYTPRAGEATTVYINFVAPGYFQTMGIPLLGGRDFEEADRTDGTDKLTRAIVNRHFVERFFGGRSAIGQRFRAGSNRDLLLVGVVEDTNILTLREGARDIVYYPMPRTWQSTLVVRPKPGVTAAAATSAIHTVIASVDGSLTATVGRMEELVQQTLARDRLIAELSAGLAVVALILACIGLYGVMAYAVSARRTEIGVRMATGAQRFHIVRMVLRETLGITAAGIAIGLPISLAGARLLESQLFAVSPWDPIAVICASAAMIGVALLAGYLPARRAAQLDPVRALRSE